MMGTNYTHHDIDKYDNKFQAVPAIRWDPWVGKHYDKTRILILGDSTYIGEDGIDWTKGEGRLPNRMLVKGHGMYPTQNSSPGFADTTRMFLEGANRNYNDEKAREAFWGSVAFQNYCQCSVFGQRGPCRCLEDSSEALAKVFEILEPRLCIAWTVELWDFELGEVKNYGERISRVQPRIARKPGFVVGMRHPSKYFPRSKWLEYLRYKAPEECQNEMCKFLEHLKTV